MNVINVAIYEIKTSLIPGKKAAKVLALNHPSKYKQGNKNIVGMNRKLDLK